MNIGKLAAVAALATALVLAPVVAAHADTIVQPNPRVNGNIIVDPKPGHFPVTAPKKPVQHHATKPVLGPAPRVCVPARGIVTNCTPYHRPTPLPIHKKLPHRAPVIHRPVLAFHGHAHNPVRPPHPVAPVGATLR